MDMYEGSGLLFPKPTPRSIERKVKEKTNGQKERKCRQEVKARDKGKCQIPGCKERGAHQHHIVYRSRSKRLKFSALNRTTLCVDHHRLLHDGVIKIERNEDGELIVTGDTERLKFRL